jgi:hypothetical protein
LLFQYIFRGLINQNTKLKQQSRTERKKKTCKYHRLQGGVLLQHEIHFLAQSKQTKSLVTCLLTDRQTDSMKSMLGITATATAASSSVSHPS